MKKRIVVLALVGGVGIGVLAARLSRPRQTAAPSAQIASPDDAANAALTEELEALRKRVANMERSERVRGQAEGKTLGAQVEDEAHKQDEAARQEKVRKYYTPELEAKLFTSYFAGLDEVRRAEGVDLPWARGIEASVRKSLSGGGRAIGTLQIPSVECGRTLCRMELASTDAVTKDLALAELLQAIGPELPQVSVFVPVGSNRMTGYFARPGTDLPPMPSAEDLVADLP
ncbi:MAG TPA: hypothetical protein VHJ20_21820 [Polyangia bacterium]|nr:hypothetical protein [Polyangia bacterium]